jgi:hypothetical protein
MAVPINTHEPKDPVLAPAKAKAQNTPKATRPVHLRTYITRSFLMQLSHTQVLSKDEIFS